MAIIGGGILPGNFGAGGVGSRLRASGSGLLFGGAAELQLTRTLAASGAGLSFAGNAQLQVARYLAATGAGLTFAGDAELTLGGAASLSDVILGTQAVSLAAYWPCDDASGDLVDATANGVDVGPVGSPTYSVAGQVGDCVRLNGTTDYFSETGGLSNMLPALYDGNWTVFCMARPTTLNTNDKIIGFTSESGANELIWVQTGISTSSSLGLRLRSDSNDHINAEVKTSVFTANVWVGLAVRFIVSGGSTVGADIFVNGTKTSVTLNDTTYYSPTGATFHPVIGAQGFGTVRANPFQGDIQHVAAWTTDLSDSEITAITTATGL